MVVRCVENVVIKYRNKRGLINIHVIFNIIKDKIMLKKWR